MTRLPIPGADDGSWGDILNEFLGVIHEDDGTLKPGAVSANTISDGTIPHTKLDTAAPPAAGNVLAYDGTQLTWTTNVSGVTDHGALTGLSDDDHPQYHNDARGDARYYTKSQVDTSLSTKANTNHTHAQSDITGLASALANKEPTIAAGNTAQYWRGDKSWQTLDKAAVGLSNADNTSDANKPISTAMQAALDLKADASRVDVKVSTGSVAPTNPAVGDVWIH